VISFWKCNNVSSYSYQNHKRHIKANKDKNLQTGKLTREIKFQTKLNVQWHLDWSDDPLVLRAVQK
jgi:hypothetical protein